MNANTITASFTTTHCAISAATEARLAPICSGSTRTYHEDWCGGGIAKSARARARMGAR